MPEPTNYRQPPFPSTTLNPGANTARAGAPPTDGVLGRRFVAYVIDIVVIFGVVALLFVAIGVLGILTLGLGWFLWGLLFPPVIAIIYNALTIGGPAQSTIGMRMTGLRVFREDGSPPDKITAAVHALLFYVAASTFVLWLVDVVIGMVRDDRRMGHDLLTGLILVRNR
jgi:uncharacterized RDD family membrane protein YckC